MDTWDVLKRVVKSNLNIDPIVLDYVACFDILDKCARGKSIQTICRELEEEYDYVLDAVSGLFLFSGFDRDIPIDCRQLYLKYRYNKYAFISVGQTLAPYVSKSDFVEAFRINRLLDLIEKAVEKYYE